MVSLRHVGRILDISRSLTGLEAAASGALPCAGLASCAAIVKMSADI
jgi:hypothetical protein